MKKQQPVTLCGETLTAPLHICAFFDSREEQYEVLLPWLKEGINSNEEVLTILSSDSHKDHCSRLSHAGIPVEEVLTKGQLKIVATEDSYIQGGTFAAKRMFDIVEQALIDAQKGPYGNLRACGDMEWALKHLPGTDELIEYEARLNLLTPKHDCSILCGYDINKFSGSAIADVLATHPQVIMNGRIHMNPHYVDPVEFLGKLINRPKRPLAFRVSANYSN
ncbi:MAG TPA: MEDS domain-containing protein [Cyclobacteriaceae bacterium]|nr:MEDS domain-containing protein [Cyclobacteriaceae bacterium]